MQIPGPTSPISRRLLGIAVLAAVFASGWYLGQPLSPPECEVHERTYSDHFEAIICDPDDDKPRVLAWFTGDLR
ncbi:hypothetical protein [Streptomyces odontomachi]|uniref:hypothetical protein n=1 Tax=Streptomyces odontomachi TaxID=2944940 RepID=UPI00210B4D48|nr:hypothetical protein [Streptomyces sp. ODS25]